MLDRYLRYNPHRTPVQKDFRLMTPRNYYYPLVITLQASASMFSMLFHSHQSNQQQIFYNH